MAFTKKDNVYKHPTFFPNSQPEFKSFFQMILLLG